MSTNVTSPALESMMPSEAMSRLLAENWWLVALRSVAAIVFGVLTLILPGVTLAALVLLFSAYMLVDGVFAIVSAVRAARKHGRWLLLVLEGVADLAAGAIAFFWPLITVVAFVYVLAFWALVSGALMLGAAFRLNQTHGRWWMILGGVLSMVWGLLLVIAPIAGAVVLTLWLGAYALVFGGLLLGLALRLRRHRLDESASVAIGSPSHRPT